MGNPNAPHRAVLWIQAELHELNKAGECSGNPTLKVDRFCVALDGQDRPTAERQLNELLAELKRRCPAR